MTTPSRKLCSVKLLAHGIAKNGEDEERVSQLIARFGLEANKDRRPASVSGGLRKATSVARAFVMDPVMIIMDDPFVGLDRDQITNLMQLLEEHRQTKRLKHVFFTLRGETGSSSFAARVLKIEDSGLKIDWNPQVGLRKVENQ
jgi:energy-coupling factor transporter ATP-binding protein EcfA2